MNIKYFKIFILTALLLNNKIFVQVLPSDEIVNQISNQFGVPNEQVETLLKQNDELFENSVPLDQFDENIENSIINDMENVSDIDLKLSSKENEENFSIGETINTFELKKNELDNNGTVNSDSMIFIQKLLEKEKYFGYDIFYQDPDVFENSSDIAIDPNYLVGPGDEIVIMLWGETEINKTYKVSKDGYLFLNNIGQVFVNGLTIEKLEEKLFKQFKKVYSSLGKTSGIDRTYFDVSLGKMVHRPIRIFALGEIDQPGAYSISPYSTVFSSLYYFNGPSINGSLRNVKLIRNGKEHSEVDLYNFLLSGKKSSDIRLQRDDVIFLPTRGKTVTIKGEINRPHIYELKDGESLIDLIEIAGGLLSTTYHKRAQVDRIIDPNERARTGINRTLIDVAIDEVLDGSNVFQLFDSDTIRFFKIDDMRKNIVEIRGPVLRPGFYDLRDNMSISDLIVMADGLAPSAYKGEAYITSIHDGFTKKIKTINLQKALTGDSENNIQLLSGDVLEIFDNNKLKFFNDIHIGGHVLNPGKIEFKLGTKLKDAVFLGGGFQNDEHLRNAYMERADLIRWDRTKEFKELISFRLDLILEGKGKSDLELMMGDSIRIYSKSEVEGYLAPFASISGFVKRPGKYDITDGMIIKDLLFMAGGFRDEKHINSTFLPRADLYRFNNNMISKSILRFNLEELLNGSHEFDDSVYPGDELRIYSSDQFKNTDSIFVKGAVLNEGLVELKTNMTVIDAILESGGIEKGYKNFKVEIARKLPNDPNRKDYSNIITRNFENKPSTFDLKKETKGDILLEPNDFIMVNIDPFQLSTQLVYIGGFVSFPGDYVLNKSNIMVTDLINRAGGIREEGYPEASRLIRKGEVIKLSFDKILKRPKSRHNFELMDGDTVLVGSKSNIVQIIGEVNSPGNYRYYNNFSLKDYIKMAGGYTRNASIRASYVEYPDGRSKQFSFYKRIRVADSSVINIGAKEQIEPFSFTEYASKLTSIYADLTQALLLVTLAGRN